VTSDPTEAKVAPKLQKEGVRSGIDTAQCGGWGQPPRNLNSERHRPFNIAALKGEQLQGHIGPARNRVIFLHPTEADIGGHKGNDRG
jgi:hypothetical protein